VGSSTSKWGRKRIKLTIKTGKEGLLGESRLSVYSTEELSKPHFQCPVGASQHCCHTTILKWMSLQLLWHIFQRSRRIELMACCAGRSFDISLAGRSINSQATAGGGSNGSQNRSSPAAQEPGSGTMSYCGGCLGTMNLEERGQ
jgi:hypothetical protein